MARDDEILGLAERIHPRYRGHLRKVLDLAGEMAVREDTDEVELVWRTEDFRFTVNYRAWVQFDFRDGSSDQLDGWNEVHQFTEMIR